MPGSDDGIRGKRRDKSNSATKTSACVARDHDVVIERGRAAVDFPTLAGMGTLKGLVSAFGSNGAQEVR